MPTALLRCARHWIRSTNLPSALSLAISSTLLPVFQSDWKTGKSVEEIAKLKADGKFVDLIQWRAHRSNAVGMADEGYVLEWRLGDAGKDPFSGNADAKTHQPKFMWDEKKVGYPVSYTH